jgi:hypothetical protein
VSKHLFVGGPVHGSVREVDIPGQPTVTIARYSAPPPIPWVSEAELPELEMPDFEFTTYWRERRWCRHRFITIYIADRYMVTENIVTDALLKAAGLEWEG